MGLTGGSFPYHHVPSGCVYGYIGVSGQCTVQRSLSVQVLTFDAPNHADSRM